MRKGTKHSQKSTDAARASALMNKLQWFAEAEPPEPLREDQKDDLEAVSLYEKALWAYNKKQMTPAQVQAATTALKKLKPDLSSVEQTVIDERDDMSEEQLLAQMKVLIETSPSIAAALRSMLEPVAPKLRSVS